MARKRPWVLVSYSPDETARCLLSQARSVQAAHEAITRNADWLRRPKRDVPDAMLLLMARRYQRRHECSDNAALQWVANKRVKGDHPNPVEAKASLVRRLRRGLNKRSLAQFSRLYPKWMLPELK